MYQRLHDPTIDDFAKGNLKVIDQRWYNVDTTVTLQLQAVRRAKHSDASSADDVLTASVPVNVWSLQKTMPLPECLLTDRHEHYFRVVRFGPEDITRLGMGKKQREKKNPYGLTPGSFIYAHNVSDFRLFWAYGNCGCLTKPWQLSPGKLPGRDAGHAYD